jgi:hypothetical protein
MEIFNYGYDLLRPILSATFCISGYLFSDFPFSALVFLSVLGYYISMRLTLSESGSLRGPRNGEEYIQPRG